MPLLHGTLQLFCVFFNTFLYYMTIIFSEMHYGQEPHLKTHRLSFNPDWIKSNALEFEPVTLA